MATTTVTLTHNATTNIVVGNMNTDSCVVVKYSCTRNYLYDCGEIVIINKATPEFNWKYYYYDCGFSITVDINGNNLRLNITVDNARVDDIVFNYNLLTLN